jgi:glycosyltransferase involved in cell wall biosynthesis
MRIIHLTASAFFGGPERQMLGLATALPAGYSSTFLSFSEGGRCRPFLAAARAAGFDAAELGHDTPDLRAAVREVSAFLRGNFADVLITHGYKSNLLGRPAARQAGVPIVSVSRGWTRETLKVRCYEALDRFHLRFMDRVVCVSDGQAEKVRRAGVPEDRVRVIRNAARSRPFAKPHPNDRDRLRALAGGDGPIVLAAGRLSPEKGFGVLVDAAAKVLRAVPGVRFVLFGEGAQRAALERRVAAAGLTAAFRLVGFRNDLDALLPWADVLALPSFTEGLPNVALEAAAAGLPVVATSVGGVPEVVAHGQTGYLVPPGHPGALAARLTDLLQRPDWARAFGAAARRRMEEQFSFAGQARAYQELFAELVPVRARIGFRRAATCA